MALQVDLQTDKSIDDVRALLLPKAGPSRYITFLVEARLEFDDGSHLLGIFIASSSACTGENSGSQRAHDRVRLSIRPSTPGSQAANCKDPRSAERNQTEWHAGDVSLGGWTEKNVVILVFRLHNSSRAR